MKADIRSYTFLPIIASITQQDLWGLKLNVNWHRKTKLSMAAVEKMVSKEMHRMTQDFWASCIKHAENLKEEDYSKEMI
jgi:hypothetical protein